MKKLFAVIFFVLIFFQIVSPNCFAIAPDSMEAFQQAIEDRRDTIAENQSNSVWEITFTELFLDIGDYAHDFLNKTFNEEITIDKIIYNDVDLLNANFFDNSVNAASSTVATTVKKSINYWYNLFRTLAIVVIFVGIIAIGIKILLKTSKGLEEAKELGTKILMAFVLVFLFPYVMRYTFDINQAFITYIRQNVGEDAVLGNSLDSEVSDLEMEDREDLEFRSPEYISTKNNRVAAGSDEATTISLNRLENYVKNMDVMRIMRAMAGVTLRFVYVIFWYIMLFQTYVLVIIYLKRYIQIAFLLAIYPLVTLGYVTGILEGNSTTAFNRWCGKFFSCVLLQMFHAIIYGVISGVIISQIKGELIGNLDSLNWLLMIVAISFIFTGEKIITRFWKVATNTESDRKGIMNMIKAPGDITRKVKALIPHKK